MSLENFILTCEKDNEQLRKDIDYYKNYNKRLKKENQQLKEKLEASEKARKEAIAYIKENSCRICYFDKEENRYKTNESKVLEILDIDKGE